MKIRSALMLCTALLMPVPAHADPVTAFFTALAGGSATSAAAAAAIGGATAFAYSAGAFFTTTLGSLLLSVGLSVLLAPEVKAPTIEQARVNTRLVDAQRWQLAGTASVGGELGTFAEYDDAGNFWFFVVHGDAEMVGTPRYFLDNIEVTLSDGTDGFTAGDVLTDAFCLTTGWDQFEGEGPREPVFRIYPVTPTSAQVYGTRPAAFAAAFPDLPADFYLAGVSYSIVRCLAVPPQHYGKAYRWRGSLGLGEPSVSVVSNFNRMYDPRIGSHDIDDQTTWTAGDGNPVIIWAWFRTAPYGRNKAMTSINWTRVAAEADKCDATVLDRSGEAIPRYRAGFAFPDNKPRHECEREILQTMDAFTVYDDEGRAWPRVGVYEAPTLTFSAARDIMSEQTEIIDDGEAEIDGVIVEYISPDHGYTKQPAAPWRNTNYYDGSLEPNYKTIPVLGCQNHNQAVRLAKAYGKVIGAERKAALGTTIKGILAKGERTIDLDLDAEFTGPYRIASPVIEAPSGTAASFAVVPIASGDYDLEAGEEGAPPALAPVLDIDDGLEVAANVAVTSETILTASGAAVRLVANFDEPDRLDRFFRFRYRAVGDTGPRALFTTEMDDLFAYSPIVSEGTNYVVSWRTVTAGGRATAWSDERDTPVSITVTATAVDAPTDLSGVAATGGLGRAIFTGTGSASGNFRGVRIYRAPAGGGFGSASVIQTLADVEAGAAFSITVGGAAPDNLVVNGGFDDATGWSLGTGWSIAGGVASHVTGSASVISRTATIAGGQTYRFSMALTDAASGTVQARIIGGSTVVDSAADDLPGIGLFFGTITAPTTPLSLGVRAGGTFEGTVDDFVMYAAGPDAIDQGAGNFFIVPVSFSGAEGTPSGPYALTIQ